MHAINKRYCFKWRIREYGYLCLRRNGNRKNSININNRTINSSTFISCKNLKEIDVSKNNNFIFESNILFDKNKTNILFISTIALKNTNTFSIPEGIKSYSTDISGMTNIKKIIIPASLTDIDPNKLPKSIESIEIKNGNKTLLYENGFYIIRLKHNYVLF